MIHISILETFSYKLWLIFQYQEKHKIHFIHFSKYKSVVNIILEIKLSCDYHEGKPTSWQVKLTYPGACNINMQAEAWTVQEQKDLSEPFNL